MEPAPGAQQVSVYPDNADVTFAAFKAGGLSLEVRCTSKACDRIVYYASNELIRLFGAGCTPGHIAGRLVCLCGLTHPAMRAVIRAGSEATPNLARKVDLRRGHKGLRREPEWPNG
jgi:hypothetical protein